MFKEMVLGCVLAYSGTAFAAGGYYEPNDSIATAFDFSAHPRQLINSVYGHDPYCEYIDASTADYDYFKIVLPAHTTRLHASVNGLNAADHPGCLLYDAAGNQKITIGGDTYVYDNADSVDWNFAPANSDRYYYLCVFSYKKESSGSGYVYSIPGDTAYYSLSWYFDDKREPDNSSSAAYALGVKADGEAFTGVQADIDYTKFYAVSGGKIQVDCSFTNADGDIDIDLYNSAHIREVLSAGSGDGEHIAYTVPDSEYYYLKVYGENNANLYTLSVDSDDAYAPNGARTNAYLLPNSYGQLADLHGIGLGYQEYDWYRLEVPAGHARIHLKMPLTDGPVDARTITLCDASGSSLASASANATQTNTVPELHYTSASAGTYYVKVLAGATDAISCYDMLWSCDDAYGLNDSLGNAYSLAENHWLSDIAGKGQQWSDDWYKLTVSGAGGTLFVECTFTNSAGGDIDMKLYDASGTQLQSATSVTDNETITRTVGAGTYYIRIYGAGSDPNDGQFYDLHYTQDDAYEDDDTLATAQPLTGGSFKNYWLSEIQGWGVMLDDDWYKIETTATDRRILVECDFLQANGNIDIDLCDSNGTVVATSATSTDDEWIDKTVSGAGDWYIHVTGDLNGSWYDMRWNAIPPGDDVYEVNNTLAGAYDLSANENKWLSDLHGEGHQKNDDFYKITVPAGKQRVWIRLQSDYSYGGYNNDVALLDDNGTELEATQEDWDEEYINYVVPGGGTFYLKVFGDNNGGEYDLFWHCVPHTDDVYEENDVLGSGVLFLTRGTSLSYIGGRAIQRDTDVYRIYVPSGREALHVDATFSNTEGDIALRLADSTGRQLAAVDSATDNERLETVVAPGAWYYVLVNGENRGNLYDLSWNGTADQAPTNIMLSSSTVSETNAPGTVVGALTAQDPDSGDELDIVLLPTATYPDNAQFDILSGNLRIATWMDYEEQSVFSVGLRATDRAGKSVEKTVTVNVVDVDETPNMTQPEVTPSGTGLIIHWQSFVNNRYTVYSSTNLLNGFTPAVTNIPATPPQNSYTGVVDGVSARFWKIGTE